MPHKNVKIHTLSSVTSTNDVAKEYAENGGEDLYVVHADVQTAGRGRRGRVWATIPRESVACSILVKEKDAPHLALITAIAVCQTVKNWLKSAKIKWPNDVLVNDKKLSGILVERHGKGENTYYIVGTGINVGLADCGFWEEFPQATSIVKECEDGVPSVQDVLEIYVQHFVQILNHYRENGWDNFLSQIYKENCVSLGQQVIWQYENHQIKGEVVDIDENGILLLKTKNGKIERILSGDIIKDAQPINTGKG